MEIYIERQLAGILYALIVGAALGAVYDVLRISRVILGLHPGVAGFSRRLPLVGEVARTHTHGGLFSSAVIFVEDILFFAAATVVYTVFVYHAGDGDNRWFFTLAAVCGFALYFVTVGRLVLRASGAIRFFLCAALDYTLFFALLPARFVLHRAILPLRRRIRVRLLEKTRKKAKKRLENDLRFMYNKYGK